MRYPYHVSAFLSWFSSPSDSSIRAIPDIRRPVLTSDLCFPCLFQCIVSFGKPFMIVVIRCLCPPVRKFIQRNNFSDIGASVLFGITADCDKMMAVFFELNPVNAVSCPTAVRIQNGSIHIQKLPVLHCPRYFSAAKHSHLLFTESYVQHKSLMLSGHGFIFPVTAAGNSSSVVF